MPKAIRFANRSVRLPMAHLPMAAARLSKPPDPLAMLANVETGNGSKFI
jgi:hypothetical protein